MEVLLLKVDSELGRWCRPGEKPFLEQQNVPELHDKTDYKIKINLCCSSCYRNRQFPWTWWYLHGVGNFEDQKLFKVSEVQGWTQWPILSWKDSTGWGREGTINGVPSLQSPALAELPSCSELLRVSFHHQVGSMRAARRAHLVPYSSP